ncbi:MAG: sigma-70 family RNA polymerase sigma factor [Tepidisphaeraceae bacterium]
MDDIYERLLVLRCQTGDASAFSELLSRYDGRIRGFLGRLLNGTGAVDDVAQDIWLDVFRTVGGLRDAGAFRAWLYRIARDRAFRLLRRRRTPRPVTVAPDVVEQVVDDQDSGPYADEVLLLQAALVRLPPEQHEVIWLRVVEGFSYEQIARTVGCELGTVRSRLHYAKRALRDQFTKD